MWRTRIVLRFVAKYWENFLRWTLGLVGLVGSAWALVHEFAVLATGLFLVSAWLLWRGVSKFVAQRREVVPRPRSRSSWRYLSTYDGWSTLGAGRTHAIFSRELNHRLASGDPITVVVGSEWLPARTSRAHELRERVIERLAFNDKKYRLATDLLPDSSTVTLEITDYASMLTTNRLAYVDWGYRRPTANDKDDDYLTFAALEPLVAATGTLPDLASSNCSNHLGGDVLSIGSGFFFLQQQGRANHMYPGFWIPSAAGSFDLADLTSSGTLQDLVRTGLLRELVEELDLRPPDRPALADVRVIGYSRATYMGGKPQFYGVCRIGDIQPGRDRFAARHTRVTFDGGGASMVDALEHFCDEHHDQVAPPLEMMLEALRNWVADDPDAEQWLWPVPALRRLPTTSLSTCLAHSS